MADIDIITVVNPEQYSHQSTTHSQQGRGSDRDGMTTSVDLKSGEVLDGTGFKVRDFQDLFELFFSSCGLVAMGWSSLSTLSTNRIQLFRVSNFQAKTSLVGKWPGAPFLPSPN